jgi:hypothetical protein
MTARVRAGHSSLHQWQQATWDLQAVGLVSLVCHEGPRRCHCEINEWGSCCVRRVGGDRIATGVPPRRTGSRAQLERCFALLDAGDGDSSDSYNNHAGGQRSKAVATQFVTVFGCDPGNTSVELSQLQNGVLTAGVIRVRNAFASPTTVSPSSKHIC